MTTPLTTARLPVGTPTHERRLTDFLVRNAGFVMRPGTGRSLYILNEPAVGRGRPDVIMLSISSSRFDRWRQNGRRVPTLTAARVLQAGPDGFDFGVSPAHVRDIQRTYGNPEKSALAGPPNMIGDSIAIEAKVRDWRQAVRQAAKFRGIANRAALLMPPAAIERVPTTVADFYGLGLMALQSETLSWQRKPSWQATSAAAEVWLVELLIRGLEDGTAHRFSASQNRVSASAYELRRE